MDENNKFENKRQNGTNEEMPEILTNPNKSENFQKLWKNLLYTIIWLFVIGIWYLITNAFILN